MLDPAKLYSEPPDPVDQVIDDLNRQAAKVRAVMLMAWIAVLFLGAVTAALPLSRVCGLLLGLTGVVCVLRWLAARDGAR